MAFARVLDVLATGLPDARIFVVSQFGSVPTYIKALTLKKRVNQRHRISPSSGRCAFLDARGAPIPKGVAYLEAVIHRYEAAVATACKTVANCRYDGGAFGRVVDRREYISWDLIHLSQRGQAKAAAVAWAAMKRVASSRAPAKSPAARGGASRRSCEAPRLAHNGGFTAGSSRRTTGPAWRFAGLFRSAFITRNEGVRGSSPRVGSPRVPARQQKSSSFDRDVACTRVASGSE